MSPNDDNIILSPYYNFGSELSTYGMIKIILIIMSIIFGLFLSSSINDIARTATDEREVLNEFSSLITQIKVFGLILVMIEILLLFLILLSLRKCLNSKAYYRHTIKSSRNWIIILIIAYILRVIFGWIYINVIQTEISNLQSQPEITISDLETMVNTLPSTTSIELVDIAITILLFAFIHSIIDWRNKLSQSLKNKSYKLKQIFNDLENNLSTTNLGLGIIIVGQFFGLIVDSGIVGFIIIIGNVGFAYGIYQTGKTIGKFPIRISYDTTDTKSTNTVESVNSENVKFCADCGHKNLQETNYCMKCGYQFPEFKEFYN